MKNLSEFLIENNKTNSKDAKTMAYEFVDFLNSDKSSIEEQTSIFLNNVHDNLVNSKEIESFINAINDFLNKNNYK